MRRSRLIPNGRGIVWHEQPGGELVVSTVLPDGRTIRVVGGIRAGGGHRGKVERGMLRWLAWEAASDR